MGCNSAESKLVSENIGIEPVLAARTQTYIGSGSGLLMKVCRMIMSISIAARMTILRTTYFTCSWPV